MAVVQARRPFAPHYQQIKRQRNWLIELDRRLDPPPDSSTTPTSSSVKRNVKQFLAQLQDYAQCHPDEAHTISHICFTFRQRWPRLFACYAWPERYRTNNDLETFFGRLRTRQRQIHGRKSVHEFILRYGEWAVFIDPAETFDQVLHRFQTFVQSDFDIAYARFLKAQQRLHVLYRFRHNPRRCLKQLEHQWDDAIDRLS